MSKYLNLIEVKSNGEVFPKQISLRAPFDHQNKAMAHLDLINKESSFSTLIVLPTGGGKTFTASKWLLKNAIDRKKKILWIAHRQMLLDQAAESFHKYASIEVMPHVSSFKFRIVSGSSDHDRLVDLTPQDNLLISSKDSIGRNLSAIDPWLAGENEIYFVIDEAHHSTAKTYRNIINYLQSKVPNVKLIGLTATPFTTTENEQGLLSKIYRDGVINDRVTKNKVGITYQIGLKELINRQILSKPIFESIFTEELFRKFEDLDTKQSIENLDILPENIAKQMSESAKRNKLIVETYKANKEKFGQTILFAVNVVHAIQLASLFKKENIKADYIISNIKDMVTGISVGQETNCHKFNAFRRGELDILINVNLLTKGIDLPKTKSVFLARPTVSAILMTQMVERALRGVVAGGTPTAYIVSFIDNWNDRIAWVNPENLFIDDNEFINDPKERRERELRMIAISKIEEFVSLLDDNVDTSSLEALPFIQRIPLGMYAFTYLDETSMDHIYQVMVYDSTASSYKEMMESLPDLLKFFETSEEYLPDDMLHEMAKHCEDTFFSGEMIPPYQEEDVVNIIKYFAQYEEAPKFYTFDDVDRNRLDISKMAKHIVERDFRIIEKMEYINTAWNSIDDNMLRLFFGRKIYFLRQLDIEVMRLLYPDIYIENNSNIKFGSNKLEDSPLHVIRKYNPQYEKYLRDETFLKHKNENGEYECAICGISHRSRVNFQVDHILPMNQGGKSRLDNLQILCRQCNGRKGDK